MPGGLFGLVSSALGGTTVGRAVVELVGDTSELQTSFSQARGETEATAEQGAASASKFSNAWAVGSVVAGAALLKFAVDAVHAADESERITARTNAALKSTGGAANVTGEGIQSLASRIQDYSGITDEAVRTGANMVLSFHNIRNEAGAGNDIFNQTVQATADMSAAFSDGNVSADRFRSTAIRLGRAVNDPIKGLTSLTRVGVTFTDQQKNQVTQLVHTGHELEAQKIILGGVTQAFGGSARAMGETFGGQLNILHANVMDLEESFGTLLLKGLNPLVRGINIAVDAVNKLPAPIKNTVGISLIAVTAMAAIGGAVKLVRSGLTELGIGFKAKSDIEKASIIDDREAGQAMSDMAKQAADTTDPLAAEGDALTEVGAKANDTSTQLSNAGKAMTDMGDQADGTSGPLGSTGDSLNTLGTQADDAGAQAKDAGTAFSDMGQEVQASADGLAREGEAFDAVTAKAAEASAAVQDFAGSVDEAQAATAKPLGAELAAPAAAVEAVAPAAAQAEQADAGQQAVEQAVQASEIASGTTEVVKAHTEATTADAAALSTDAAAAEGNATAMGADATATEADTVAKQENVAATAESSGAMAALGGALGKAGGAIAGFLDSFGGIAIAAGAEAVAVGKLLAALGHLEAGAINAKFGQAIANGVDMGETAMNHLADVTIPQVQAKLYGQPPSTPAWITVASDSIHSFFSQVPVVGQIADQFFGKIQAGSASMIALQKATSDGTLSFQEFVTIADQTGKSMGEAVISNEQFQAELERMLPLVNDGTISQKDWNAALAEAADRGIKGAATMLQEYRAQILATKTALADANDVQNAAGDSFDRFAMITGQTATQLHAGIVQALKGGADATQSFVKNMETQLVDFRNSTADALGGIPDLLSGFADRQNLTAAKIIKAINDQRNAVKTYGHDYNIFAKSVGDKSNQVLTAVSQMGMSGSTFLAQFADATDKQRRKMVNGLGGIQNSATSVADDITHVLVPAFEKMINKILEAAGLNTIKFNIDADTTGARNQLAQFNTQLQNQGFVPIGGKAGGKAAHGGGWIDRTFPAGPKHRERLATVLEDEFVVRPDRAREFGDVLEKINTGKVRRDDLPRFHRGGWVRTGEADEMLHIGRNDPPERLIEQERGGGVQPPPLPERQGGNVRRLGAAIRSAVAAIREVGGRREADDYRRQWRRALRDSHYDAHPLIAETFGALRTITTRGEAQDWRHFVRSSLHDMRRTHHDSPDPGVVMHAGGWLAPPDAPVGAYAAAMAGQEPPGPPRPPMWPRPTIVTIRPSSGQQGARNRQPEPGLTFHEGGWVTAAGKVSDVADDTDLMNRTIVNPPRESVNLQLTQAMLNSLIPPWPKGPVAAAWGGFRNGFIPYSAMVQVAPGKYLAPDAAAAFHAGGFDRLATIVSAYRSYANQAGIYNSGVRPAAPPGHSMHGWGKAVDTAGALYSAMIQRGAQFNWHRGISFGDPAHFSFGITAHTGGMLRRDAMVRAHQGEIIVNPKSVESVEGLAAAFSNALADSTDGFRDAFKDALMDRRVQRGLADAMKEVKVTPRVSVDTLADGERRRRQVRSG